MNGQMKRTNQILEDMLRACALKYGKRSDKSLPHVEFSYNNSYQASIAVLELDWRESSIWSRSTKGCRETGLDDQRKSKSRDRRAMRIKEGETFHSKLVISYTLRSPL
jgi:hypothetical protein